MRPILGQNVCVCSIPWTARDQHDPDRLIVNFVGCGKWECPQCGRVKKNRLIRRVLKAKPNRFLTLTVKDLPNETPRECYDRTRRKISELFRHFRKSGRSAEYWRVIEQTKRGIPHYHFLLRGPFWPQDEISFRWKMLTGAWIVDIRSVKRGKHVANYVAKYMTKGAVSFTRQRYCASRGFWLAEEPKKPSKWFHWSRSRTPVFEFIAKSHLDHLYGTTWEVLRIYE